MSNQEMINAETKTCMVYLIRHGATPGNMEGRYIGRTDQPLSEAGKEQIRERSYPHVDKVFASPMIRCIETAGIIYPDAIYRLIPELRESDFGDFEGKNYEELNGNPDYQAWIDSMGNCPFPNGESREQVRERVCEGFRRVLNEREDAEIIAVVAHGGTIMTILENLFGGNYFDYQVKNGEGYSFEISYDGICHGLCPRSYRG
jgi:alpha-ribazole phosphatase